MSKTVTRPFILALIAGFLLLSACGTQGSATPAVPSETAWPPRTATPSRPTPTPGATATGDVRDSAGVGLLEILPTRTPQPTATPDIVAETIAEILTETGLAQRTLLRVRSGDWINLGISLLYIAGGYLLGTWLIRSIFPRIVRRTKTELDDRLLAASGSEVRWLIVLLILRTATGRLTFIESATKTTLSDLYFVLILFLLVLLLFRLIKLGAKEAEKRARISGHRKESEPLITLASWALRLLVLIIGTSVTLAHFGANITGLALFLGLVGLVISLAGRDILTDFVSGAMILMDRPYRIGDRIDLPSLETWGDVVEIGMRSTKVRLIDNRMIIVPNSEIANGQIVNYSYADPAFFDQCNIMVAYDNDLDAVEQLLVETISAVDGVVPDREVGAWLMQFREYWVVFTVAWWIENYQEKFYVRNRVNRAIVRAFHAAGVNLPYGVGHLNIELNAADPELLPNTSLLNSSGTSRKVNLHSGVNE